MTAKTSPHGMANVWHSQFRARFINIGVWWHRLVFEPSFSFVSRDKTTRVRVRRLQKMSVCVRSCSVISEKVRSRLFHAVWTTKSGRLSLLLSQLSQVIPVTSITQKNTQMTQTLSHNIIIYLMVDGEKTLRAFSWNWIILDYVSTGSSVLSRPRLSLLSNYLT